MHCDMHPIDPAMARNARHVIPTVLGEG